MTIATMKTPIAERAISMRRAFDDADLRKLKRQLWRSGLTAGGSFLGGVAVVLVIAFGPALDEQSATFCAFLAVVFAGMFLVSMITYAAPLLDVAAHNNLAATLSRVELWEAQEQLHGLARRSDETLADVVAQMEIEERQRIEAILERAYESEGPEDRYLVPKILFRYLTVSLGGFADHVEREKQRSS